MNVKLILYKISDYFFPELELFPSWKTIVFENGVFLTELCHTRQGFLIIEESRFGKKRSHILYATGDCYKGYRSGTCYHNISNESAYEILGKMQNTEINFLTKI